MNKLIKELIDRGNIVVMKRDQGLYELNVNGKVVASSSKWSNFESVVLNYILEDAGL